MPSLSRACLLQDTSKYPGYFSWRGYVCISLFELTPAGVTTRYVNLDDCWADTSRDSQGRLQGQPKQFPSGMKALADYVHDKGLKLGLYTCVGTETCKKGRPGSYGSFDLDAETFAEWGVDFVKADFCHVPGNESGHTEVGPPCAAAAARLPSTLPLSARPPPAPLSLSAPPFSPRQDLYQSFSDALNATGRPMLFSLCEWGTNGVADWGGKAGQMWRVQMDHLPLWHYPPQVTRRCDGLR